MKVLKAIRKLWYFIAGNIIGRFMYSKQFFPKGRRFQSWRSQGWQWVVADFFGRIFLKRNLGVKWPVSPFTTVGGQNIEFDSDDIDNFQSPGCYYQTWDAQIHIGTGTYIAQGTGIITSNHDVYNLDERSNAANVFIGNHCWIGMNAVILPGVILGDHTVVGAGSVVTHSFPEGNCIIAGNPAKFIRKLDQSKFYKKTSDSLKRGN